MTDRWLNDINDMNFDIKKGMKDMILLPMAVTADPDILKLFYHKLQIKKR